MLELSPGWTTEVERGPGWVFARLCGPEGTSDPVEVPNLGEALWEVLQQHLTYRLVLDLADVPPLSSGVFAQLVRLHDRICEHDGVMRLCGLSLENQQAMRACCLHTHFPPYATRDEAVAGYRSPKPR